MDLNDVCKLEFFLKYHTVLQHFSSLFYLKIKPIAIKIWWLNPVGQEETLFPPPLLTHEYEVLKQKDTKKTINKFFCMNAIPFGISPKHDSQILNCCSISVNASLISLTTTVSQDMVTWLHNTKCKIGGFTSCVTGPSVIAHPKVKCSLICSWQFRVSKDGLQAVLCMAAPCQEIGLGAETGLGLAVQVTGRWQEARTFLKPSQEGTTLLTSPPREGAFSWGELRSHTWKQRALHFFLCFSVILHLKFLLNSMLC